MDSSHPLFILPDELWEAIIFDLNLCSLAYLSLTSKYFYDAVGKRFNQEYNTILYSEDKVIPPLNPERHSEYLRMESSRGLVFSFNNKVILYDREISDIDNQSFSPFITSIRSHQEFIDCLNNINRRKHVREEYLYSLDEPILELAKKSAIENIVLSILRIGEAIKNPNYQVFFVWGLRTVRWTTVNIRLFCYPDMIHAIEEDVRKVHSDFHITSEQGHVHLSFQKNTLPIPFA